MFSAQTGIQNHTRMYKTTIIDSIATESAVKVQKFYYGQKYEAAVKYVCYHFRRSSRPTYTPSEISTIPTNQFPSFLYTKSTNELKIFKPLYSVSSDQFTIRQNNDWGYIC